MNEKILIVDDDLDTLRLIALMLQRQGYQTITTDNGPEALTLSVSERPDLILLDVMMAGMDGYEVTRQLRANPITSNLPIIMFTAKAQVNDKVMGFEVGVDDYLTKPTQPRELFAHVKAVLARGRQAEARRTDDRQRHRAEPSAAGIGPRRRRPVRLLHRRGAAPRRLHPGQPHPCQRVSAVISSASWPSKAAWGFPPWRSTWRSACACAH